MVKWDSEKFDFSSLVFEHKNDFFELGLVEKLDV